MKPTKSVNIPPRDIEIRKLSNWHHKGSHERANHKNKPGFALPGAAVVFLPIPSPAVKLPAVIGNEAPAAWGEVAAGLTAASVLEALERTVLNVVGDGV